MRPIRSFYLYFMALLFGVTSFAYAEAVSHSFKILEGVVTITPALPLRVAYQ